MRQINEKGKMRRGKEKSEWESHSLKIEDCRKMEEFQFLKTKNWLLQAYYILGNLSKCSFRDFYIW